MCCFPFVTCSPAPVSIGYCTLDVGYEAYKLHNRGYVSDKGHPTTMAQLVVERSTFQAIASIAVPFMVSVAAAAMMSLLGLDRGLDRGLDSPLVS